MSLSPGSKAVIEALLGLLTTTRLRKILHDKNRESEIYNKIVVKPRTIRCFIYAELLRRKHALKGRQWRVV